MYNKKITIKRRMKKKIYNLKLDCITQHVFCFWECRNEIPSQHAFGTKRFDILLKLIRF